MRIAITGASGLVGSALTTALRDHGHDVITLVRRAPHTARERPWDPAAGTIGGIGLDDVHSVVVLSGSGIGDQLWTSAYRKEMVDSRVDSIRTIARAMAAVPYRGVERTLIIASAVGVYGANRGDEVLTENSWVGDDFLARVCRLSELTAQREAPEDVRVVAIRTGLVLSNAGGYLGTMQPIFAAGMGGPVDSGDMWMPWITRDDHVRATMHLLVDSDLEGPVNLVGPGPVMQRDFARAYGAALGRPAVVPTLSAPLIPILGPDMVEEIVRASQRVVPDRLLRDGFEFAHTRIDEALRWVEAGEPQS